MKNSTVVTFKKGRGGRFHNGGHVSFYSLCKIQDVSVLEEYMFFNEENGKWYEGNGEELDCQLNEDGTGYINIDSEYNSYYALKIEDFNRSHFAALVENDHFESDEILEFVVGENYEIFKGFEVISEVVDCDSISEIKKYASDLDWYNIEEVSEEEYDESWLDDENYREIDGKFYKYNG